MVAPERKGATSISLHPAEHHIETTAPGAGTQAGDGEPAGSPFFQNRARTVATIIIALLLAGGVWLLIGEAANWSHLLHALRRVGVWWLVLAVFGSALGYLGYAALLRVFSSVAGGPRPPLSVALRVTVIIFGASVVATSAGRLGSEYWALRRMHERPPQAWARVLAINTALWIFLAAFAGAGALAVLAGAGHAPEWLALVWLAVPLGAAVPAAYLSSPARHHLSADRGGKIRRTVAAALRGLVLIRRVGRRPALAGRSALGGALIWGGELVTLWAALRAFGVDIGYGPLVIGYATGFASSMLPLPAGGAGGVDAASAYALTLVGVPLGPALLATFVQRVCTYWLPLVVAIVAARSVKRLSAALAAVYRPPDPLAVAGAPT